jgi:rRNA maturation endonuclease Nob1
MHTDLISLSLSDASIETLKKKIEKMKQKAMCVACKERLRKIQFLPCQHFLYCEVCGQNIKKCEICKAGVETRQILRMTGFPKVSN